MKSIKSLVIAISIPEAVGIISALLTAGTMDIYVDLARPHFSPPGWVFAPVWTALYAMMGYASYRIWMKRHDDKRAKDALIVYALQLALNFIWPILFFRWGLRGMAFAEVVALLFAIALAAAKFFEIDRISGYIMIPYLAWVSFASVLNCSIWIMNR